MLATTDDCIPGYRRLAEAFHGEGCTVFSQLFHPGREIMESADGLLAVAYAPSSVPNERFHVMPRALPEPLIADIIAGYAAAARRMHQAGLDGVEVVASHGYLPAQFLNPRVNLRQDGWGGDDTRRRRFLAEVLGAIRAATSDRFVVGLRISAGRICRCTIGAWIDLEQRCADLDVCTFFEQDFVNHTLDAGAHFLRRLA